MERKKAAGQKKNADENLALVNAAAWAWYQHGSKQAVAEFDFVPRTKPADMPSRYRVEAMRASGKQPSVTATKHEHLSSISSPTSSPRLQTRHHSILDSYRIQSISRQLGGLKPESSRSHRSSRYLDHQETLEKQENMPPISRLKQRQVICGAVQDVEESSLVKVSITKKFSPAKGNVPVVGMEACRPRRRARRGGH